MTVEAGLRDHHSDPLAHGVVSIGAVKLTVVGCSPAWPNPGISHSGYLVEADGPGRLLLDCGPGVLADLRTMDGGWPKVDAIVVTHWHLDHWGDLVPWVWGRMFGLGRKTDTPELWVPPGGIAQLQQFGTFFGTETMFEGVFKLAEYVDGEPFRTAAGLEITPVRVPHYLVLTFALRVTNGARTLAYSGDCAPSPQLVDMARDADLFLCEATLIDSDADSLPRGHLSIAEAVEAFQASGAKRLLLTHRPDELPVDEGLEKAQPGLMVEI
jgi:ribonuclease BN (tRNA processing enzyme)